jgi:hypothetical protein
MDNKNMNFNPNFESKQSNSNARALWTVRFTKIFCEVCVDEVYQGNRPNTHFTKIRWKNIEATFKNKTGKSLEYRKFKNKWDTLKKNWIIWNKLNGSETGMGWDTVKGTIAATNEWCDRKLKLCFP